MYRSNDDRTVTMTTKAPSTVKPGPADSLEAIAYAAVSGIPVSEPHDRDRLGYNVWLWLSTRKDPLEIVVQTTMARLEIPEGEAVQRIKDALQAKGIAI
jgi:hypothetical protein